MDFTFLSVTFTLVIFLLISYALNVIRLSTPLIFIYLIFCFTYVIDSDKIENNDFKLDKINNNEDLKNFSEKVDTPLSKVGTIDDPDIKRSDISKPVVSFNPKPIIIDTNIIISNDKVLSINEGSEPIGIIPSNKSEAKDKSSDFLKLNEVMICRGVYKRNPIKPGFIFANNVDSLFCYTKISNKGIKQEIKHLWYYEDKLITSVTYNIKTSYNYRSWSKKTILPSQSGQWRVDIIDNKDRVLGSRKFQISSPNDAF
tara:strand:+ start:106 stop:876 length:771 start_codon:yes stop_codon:yes gene_type:complete